MRDAQRREINGQTYVVQPLPAGIALRIGTRLTKLIAPIVMGLVGADTNGAPTLESVMSFVGRLSAIDILGHLKETDLEEISRDLAKHTKVEGVKDARAVVFGLDQIFDVHFAGALDDWMLWFAFAIEVSFGPFVEGLKAKLVASKTPSAAAPASTPSG